MSAHTKAALPDASGRAQALVVAYDQYLARQGRAQKTRVKYGHVLHFFADWLGKRDLRHLSPADVDLFLAEWEAAFERQKGRPLRRATARGRVAALRGFYAYLERSDLLVDARGRTVRNPMRAIIAPSCEQRPNDFLRPLEDAALLDCQCGETERILVWLLRWTGLRVSEACALTVADFDLTPGNESVTVARSKTNAGRRTIPVVPTLVPEVRIWLDTLATRGFVSPETPFLATRSGTAMKPTFVWRLVKRVAARAGVRLVICTCGSKRSTRHERGCPRMMSGENVSAVSPHTLRRTFGSDLLNKGVRLETVARVLGHSSTVVTERAYAQLLSITIRKELMDALGGMDFPDVTGGKR